MGVSDVVPRLLARIEGSMGWHLAGLTGGTLVGARCCLTRHSAIDQALVMFPPIDAGRTRGAQREFKDDTAGAWTLTGVALADLLTGQSVRGLLNAIRASWCRHLPRRC